MFVFTRRLEEPRNDEELVRSFQAASGQLLGVLFKATVTALAREQVSSVPASHLPRMAGFATRGAACADALGWSDEQFLKAYRSNIDRAAADYTDADLVAHAILIQAWRGTRAWLKARLANRRLPPQRIAEAMAPEHWQQGVVWRGSATDLLDYLDEKMGIGITRKQGWPREVRYFGTRLSQAIGALRTAGWHLDFERNRNERLVVIQRLGAWDGAPPDLDDTKDLLLEVGIR